MSKLPACVLHVEGDADAPAVVLLHAIATSSHMWAMQRPVLRRRFCVVTVDLPGYGAAGDSELPADLEAYAQAVVDAMAAQDLARAAMVGVSFGGMVAQQVALSHPDRVSALVLANCGARTSPELAAIWEARLADAVSTGLRGQAESTLRRWFTPAFLESSPATVAWVADMVRATSLDAYRASIRAIQGMDHWDGLPRIAVPTFCMAGSDDVATPASVVAALGERVPGSQFCLLEGAPHLAVIQDAHRFTEAVSAFLSSHLRHRGAVP